jgi:hypothetical protein
MNLSEPVGTIRALRRFPVKSMLGEELDAADLTEGARLGASGSRECPRASTPRRRGSSA